MSFEFDAKKSAANKQKHGISLEEAKKLWLVPSVRIEARSTDEPRFMMIGQIYGKFYSCIYTTRGKSLRLISLRRSRKAEERIYYECFENQ